MARKIEIPPDPSIPAAQELAREITARQSQVRVSNGVGYSANRTSAEENAWVIEYRRAENSLRRLHREAERFARRARLRGED